MTCTIEHSHSGGAYTAGQIWKNRRRAPESTFTIFKVYTRHYHDGGSAERVKGILCGDVPGEAMIRSLDHRSMFFMFPHLFWAPKPEPEEIAP